MRASWAILVIGWLAASGPALGANGVGGVAMHPQDGPHADIRITLGDDALRVDITMNLAFVDAIAPTAREDPEALPEIETPLVEEALRAYFDENGFVAIDGVPMTPRFDGFGVMRPGRELLPLFPRSGMRGLLRAGFDLWYDFETPPKKIGFVWHTFPPDIVTQGDEPGTPPPLVVQVQLRAEGQFEVIPLSADEPEHIWHATGMTIEDRFAPVPAAPPARATRQLPVLSLGLLLVAGLGLVSCAVPNARRWRLVVASLALTGAAAATLRTGRIEIDDPFAPTRIVLTDVEAIDIFQPLHANIYRAFDYSSESDIYDALSRSVDGPLLDRLYNEIYRSLIMYDEGGAVSRVKSVTPLASSVLTIGLLDPGDGRASIEGFQVRARWRVEGEVYHWGHAHRRTNEYEADYTVLSTVYGWRIAASEVREQFRVPMPGDNDTAPLAPVGFPVGVEL